MSMFCVWSYTRAILYHISFCNIDYKYYTYLFLAIDFYVYFCIPVSYYHQSVICGFLVIAGLWPLLAGILPRYSIFTTIY